MQARCRTQRRLTARRALLRPSKVGKARCRGRRPSSQKVRIIQQGLNDLRGLRLALSGIVDMPTRSALRRYQQQQGLTPHGRVNYETELALANDLVNVPQSNEDEFEGEGSDACHR